MKPRQLGTSGPMVGAIGLGCMAMTDIYGPSDDEESIATIHRALDLGATFIDTSDAYGNGRNEELVGRALKERRGQATLVTKFGNLRLPGGKPGVNGRPDYVPVACEQSLKRLDADVIDVYYLHRVDPDVPIEETVGAMARLVEQGKVRFLGLSEAAARTIRRAHAVHPIATVQSEYSLWSRDIEAEILPACRELGIGFVAYSPLGRGFLTGTIVSESDLSEKDRRRAMPRFTGVNLQDNLRLLQALKAVAAERGAAPAQIALAWLLAKGEDIIPIPGTKRRQWLEADVAAAALELSTANLAALDEAFPVGAAAGTRYPQAQMGRIGI